LEAIKAIVSFSQNPYKTRVRGCLLLAPMEVIRNAGMPTSLLEKNNRPPLSFQKKLSILFKTGAIAAVTDFCIKKVSKIRWTILGRRYKVSSA
jgi:hypothetical protein